MNYPHSNLPSLGDYFIDPHPQAATPTRNTIGVAGNIGSGKTTLAQRTRVLRVRALDYESAPDWRRLDALVHDIERLLARTIAFRFQPLTLP